MGEKYILGIDQSTQGTKALLFDNQGNLQKRCDLSHEQIINEKGWVSHDPEEIYRNTIKVVKMLLASSQVAKEDIAGLGISNQRETALVWDRKTGKPVDHAVVWQCSRGTPICEEIEKAGRAAYIQEQTGLPLSPYFAAAKMSWVIKNNPGAAEKAAKGELCCGTVDSWLVYKLTGGKVYKTDYSNASRTQLLNIREQVWDPTVCSLFDIPISTLPELCDSDGDFGETDFEGFFPHPIPIRGVLGDSHGALFGQGCLEKGMIKTTYGTGSSIMMNIGEEAVFTDKGVVTSLAWRMGGKTSYVLEGNINYTGAVISWLKSDLGVVESASETQKLAQSANPDDTTYLVPAFSGLGAPYWDSNAKAIICGITRTTKKAELVKAGLDSIAYQIYDIVDVMRNESGIPITQLRVDGGPTRNEYLMQFQCDLLDIPVQVPDAEELSGIGAAYAAGISLGIYNIENVFENIQRKDFRPEMAEDLRNKKLAGWKDSVNLALNK